MYFINLSRFINVLYINYIYFNVIHTHTHTPKQLGLKCKYRDDGWDVPETDGKTKQKQHLTPV